MWRTDSLEKTLMLGKIEGRRRRGWQRMRWLDGITDLMDMSLSKPPEFVMGREAGRAAVPGVTKIHTWLSDWTELYHFIFPPTVHSLQPMDNACQNPLSVEFSRQEYWSGLPFPLPGHLPRDQTQVSYISCINRCVLYHECHLWSPYSTFHHGCTISYPHQQCETISVSLHPSQHLFFLTVSLLMIVKCYVFLLFIFLMISDFEHFLICLLAIYKSSLEKLSSSMNTFNLVIGLFNCRNYLYILNIILLVEIRFFNIVGLPRWLCGKRICLPMQVTWVWSRSRKIPHAVEHKACTPQLLSLCSRPGELQLLTPTSPRARAPQKRSQGSECVPQQWECAKWAAAHQSEE